MGARRNFRRGERAPKRPPSRQKRPPPKKYCASTVLRGLGGMLSREKINSGAPYYIRCISAWAYLGFHFGARVQSNFRKWGYMHGAKRHAGRGKATRLLGGFGGMLPRENFKKWCVLEYILLQFCQKNLQKCYFVYKSYRYCITGHYI